MAETTRKTPKKATTTAKSVAKAAPEKKAPAKKPAAKASVAAAPAARKTPAPKKTATRKAATGAVEVLVVPTMVVSDEQRYRMIAEAAYYRAESNHFQSDPVRDWIEAEKDIAALLSGIPR